MRYEILDDTGNVVNTINVGSVDFMQSQYPDGNYREAPDIPAMTQIDIQFEISQLEQNSLMNRGIRELALRIMEDRATTIAAAQGVTADQVLASIPAYVKFKELDDLIVSLRAQL